jgi:hypothetical protein
MNIEKWLPLHATIDGAIGDYALLRNVAGGTGSECVPDVFVDVVGVVTY